ncbi:hypothetical protein [Mesorhizobium sp. CAU 1741]|uniref:hypothetical protein n=1 Tax=Mesorhizobium sp. CAU 1741 TaxID=3140366 RepID=UPI00325B0AB7
MRTGEWMQTFSGGQFWPLDPRADEVNIVDIASALSMQCRYAGHVLQFYSVAEHSVHLANYMRDPDEKRWALLHDASEAYLVDVPRPVKPYLEGYKAAETRVMEAVCLRYGLSPQMPRAVHEADNRIIADERCNLAACVAPWDYHEEPLGVGLDFMPPWMAKRAFLDLFYALFPHER